MSPTIAVLTVVYNNYEILEDFFKSLAKQTHTDYHLFIADASDHKKDIFYKGVPYTVIPVKNLGYAHGINEGIKQALKKDISRFCVINNDVYFGKDFLNNIHHALEKNPHALIGGKIYYAPEYEYHKDRYAKKDLGKVLWYAGGSVDWNHALTSHIGVDEVDQGQYDTEKETGFITGCLVCFDKTVLDTLGYWDEQYFMYYEDADFSEKAKLHGISLIYDPKIELWHKNAQSSEGSGSEFHQYHQEKARVRFALKFAPMRTKFHILKNYLLSNLNSRPNHP